MTTHAITITGFAAIAVSLIVLELAAHRTNSRVPTAGQVLGFLMQTRITRVLILLLWGWLGWHFFAR
jgi:Family of unknown function (DUF6186)